MLLPTTPQPSLQPTPQEPARQPLNVIGSHPAPQPTSQPTSQEVARKPLYMVGGHQAPPSSAFVLVSAPPQPPQQAPLYLAPPFQQ